MGALVGVGRSGETFNSVSFRLISSHFLSSTRAGGGCARTLILAFSQGEKDLQGVSPGPIWPCLASFTPTVEARNEATLASFGTPLTPTHRASMRPRWPRLASSGVRRSGVTFNSVAFSCIWLHSLSSTWPKGGGTARSCLRGTRMRTTYVTNVATDGAMA